MRRCHTGLQMAGFRHRQYQQTLHKRVTSPIDYWGAGVGIPGGGQARRSGLNIAVSAGSNPALVLNADYRPLSYYPLSLWSWQDAIKAVFLDRVNIVSEYDIAVHSPNFQM